MMAPSSTSHTGVHNLGGVNRRSKEEAEEQESRASFSSKLKSTIYVRHDDRADRDLTRPNYLFHLAERARAILTGVGIRGPA
ncbi:hypothetical protein PGT21_024343 [Puccinia graminis f. sp. tritici]|uniref:Uncharacterized protein n=1 Tax=Puccinia graminis f. sp. tritici TaxID=56615 RepID=A0A5B0PYC3_PUCGR|nr:hypothetical protein PGT21_024343 [Puccinia graminis f. sp. tritici]